VAVPALGEHDIIAPHALVAGHIIYIAPVQGISDVKVPGGIGRWGVYDVLRLIGLPVEIIDGRIPALYPFLFYTVKVVFFGDLAHQKAPGSLVSLGS
jgi:hypothetical protein